MATLMTQKQALAKYGPWLAALLLLTGVIGYTAGSPQAPPPTSTTTSTIVPPSSRGTACGAGPAVTVDSTGQRSDRVPAAGIASAPGCASIVQALYLHGSGRSTLDRDLGIETGQKRLGTPEQKSNDYSIPTCTATTTIRVYHRPGSPGSFQVPRGATVPWSPTCDIAGGKDANIVVLAPQPDGTLQEWDFWIASTAAHQSVDHPQVACSTDLNNTIQKGLLTPNGLDPGVPPYDPATAMCAAGAVPVTGPDGKMADLNTQSPTSPGSNGGGVPLTRGQPGVQQIIDGRITQTMKLMTANTPAGPECLPPATVTIPLTSCATAVAPAGQFEGGGSNVTPAQHATQVMEGSRIVLVMTDQERDATIAAKNLNPVTSRCLTILVDGFRNYGVEILGTSPPTAGAHIDVDGGTPQAWVDQCLQGANPDHLLDGLFRPEWMRVLESPWNQCLTGLSRFQCWAFGAVYQPAR